MSLIDIRSYLITDSDNTMIAVYEEQKTDWNMEEKEQSNVLNNRICKYLHSDCVICKCNKKLVNLENSTSEYFNQQKNALRSSLCVEIRIM